ncbi:MAG: YwmB family TATA-box binding protein [Firmicutes bacterium]|nr:YwmB family TATA-box binding protein [Bacillota bacterium]
MKFAIFVALSLALVIIGLATPNRVRLEELSDMGIFRIYSTEVVESPLFQSVASVGFAFIYSIDPRDAERARAKFTRIDGESISFSTSHKDVDTILRTFGANVVSVSQIGSISSTLAHTNRNDRFIVTEGQRVNLQIAVNGGRTTVGWPMILGSF